MPLHSLFQDVTVYFNDDRVYGGDQTNPYHAMLTTMLSYSETELKKQLMSTGFYKDAAGSMEAATNTGYVERKKWNTGRVYIGKLFADIFQLKQYLLNGVTVKVKLQHSPNEFGIMCHTAAAKPKFIINNAYLSVRHVTIAPAITLAHNKALANGYLANYAYDQKIITTYNIAKGNKNWIKENLFRGMIPKMLVIGMVSTDAYVGAYAKNPFNFQHFNTSLVSLKKDGEHIPFQPFEPHFETATSMQYMREYLSIHESLGGKKDLIFSQDEYPNGYCLFMFKLTPDMSMITSTAQSMETPNLRLELKFGTTGLTGDITLLLMAYFQGELTIDYMRRCYVNDI